MINVHRIVRTLGAYWVSQSAALSVAESCTGGLIAATLTAYPGSSQWFSGGVVSYTARAKTALLGVPRGLLEEAGAVSEGVALAMAEGARARFHTDVALSVTGIAGPQGGSAAHPVGTVWIAWLGMGDSGLASQAIQTGCYHFKGDRQAVREAAMRAALSYFYRCVPIAQRQVPP